MEGVELAIPVAVAVPNLMGSEGLGGARSSGVGDAEGCDAGRGLVFAGPKIEKCSGPVTQRDSALQSSSWMKKADTESCRNTVLLSTLPKEDMTHELYSGSISSSLVLTTGSEGKQLQKKEGRASRTSPGCFKRPQTPQLDMLMSTAGDVNMKDASDELGLNTAKRSYAEKSQPLKHKNSLNGKRGDRRNSKGTSKIKHDGLAGFSPALGGIKLFGTYGLKPDVHDISKLLDDISLKELLDGSYKCAAVSNEKGKRPANNSENILHSARKAVSVLQHRGLSQVNKQYDEMDVSFSKEFSLPISNLSMSSNLDVDEDSSLASDLSCSKVHESCVNTEAPADTSDLPLSHPRDIIKKLALPPPKDLESLLDLHPGKPVSNRVTLPTFSWSQNYNGHSKSNSDSVKVSSRSSCPGRWIRMVTTDIFLRVGTESFADLDSLTYDHSLVPSGSVKYILPETGKTVTKIGSPLVSEHVSSSVLCRTSFQSPPALHSPRAMNAARTLHDIANSSPKQTSNGIIKWPKQPSQKAMKARKSKSIQSSEDLLTPKSETMPDNTARFTDHTTPWKKPKLLISEKRDHSGQANAQRAPYLWSAPRSSRSSPIRASRESAPDANRNHMNGSFPKPILMAPPRRVSEKTNHSQHKLRKVLQMDWNRGKTKL